MTHHDRRHYRFATRDAEAHYRAERPDLAWRVEPFHYQRRPEDQLVILLKGGAGTVSTHYLVGR